MKYLIVLMMVFSVIGCSKKESHTSATATPIIAKDLGKDSKYFSDLYGTKSSEKHESDYNFSLPSVGHLISMNGPFVVQKFSSEKLNVTVVFPAASAQAIWVKYTLPNPWTEDQIKAALVAYDNKWSSVIANNGVSGLGEALMKTMMPAVTPSTFQSNSGVLACKTIANELMIYSPVLVQDLSQLVTEQEKQKSAVPKF